MDTTERAFTGKPGDTFTFNGSCVTVLSGIATFHISTPGKIDIGRRNGLISKGIRRPRRRRRTDKDSIM